MTPGGIWNFSLLPFFSCYKQHTNHTSYAFVLDSAEGVSAYSGGLWVACLKAASKMAECLDIPEDASSYETQYHKAATRYNQALWNSKV